MPIFYRTIATLLLASPLLADAIPPAKINAGDKVARMVDFIKSNKGLPTKRADKQFSVTEDEINAYIRTWIKDEAQHARHKELSVKSAEVRFKDGHVLEVDAVAQVGLSSLKALDSLGDSFLAQKLKQSLTMDNTIHLQCLVTAAKGKGFLTVQEIRIKIIPVPISLVQEILRIVGEKQHPPKDFNKPLDLPNGIQRIEILPQTLKLSVTPTVR